MTPESAIQLRPMTVTAQEAAAVSAVLILLLIIVLAPVGV